MTRRVGFPTWSWTSLTGEIFNDDCVPESVFGAYLMGLTKESSASEADIFFSLRLGGRHIPINEVLSTQGMKIIPEEEDSHKLLVEGNIIRLKRTLGDSHQVLGTGKRTIELPTSYDIAIPQGAEISEKTEHDALILINWNDSQRKASRRFVGMLLEWVEDGVAERRGLVSHYRLDFSAKTLREIPVTRKRFILR
jgi:hypothetical protein